MALGDDMSASLAAVTDMSDLIYLGRPEHARYVAPRPRSGDHVHPAATGHRCHNTDITTKIVRRQVKNRVDAAGAGILEKLNTLFNCLVARDKFRERGLDARRCN